ncbi:MAG: Fic family protein [Lachnospiraceae bacterium]|nr:Fic family protein [Lachnospiraceae bacterium]
MTREEERGIVEKMIAQLQAEFAANDRKGLYALIQKQMAYNSNKIEGSTLTSEQTASLFDTGTLYAEGDTIYRSKDIEEMTGHFKMFNHMLKTLEQPLSEELIKEFHYCLKVGVFEDAANGYPVGEYKNRANQVSDIRTVLPKDIPAAMQRLLSRYENTTYDPLVLAQFHAEYEQIHPFQDGNGRTGRLLLLRQCLQHRRMPVIIQDEDKLTYYHVLHTAQVDQDARPLADYFIKRQHAFWEQVKEYLPQQEPEKTTKPHRVTPKR